MVWRVSCRALPWADDNHTQYQWGSEREHYTKENNLLNCLSMFNFSWSPAVCIRVQQCIHFSVHTSGPTQRLDLLALFWAPDVNILGHLELSHWLVAQSRWRQGVSLRSFSKKLDIPSFTEDEYQVRADNGCLIENLKVVHEKFAWAIMLNWNTMMNRFWWCF